MKNLITGISLPAAGISILAASPCLAQGAIVPSPQQEFQTGRKRMHSLRLNFVQPSVMAWWLDSKNHAAPLERGANAASPSPPLRYLLTLPAGVDRIVAVDPQKVLLIFGTDEGMAKLREIVAALDRPQRQIIPETRKLTLEARLVTVQNDQMTRFLADLSTASTQNPPTPVPMGSNDEIALGDLILKRKARLESARLLTIEDGATQTVDFGPARFGALTPQRRRDFSSQMPVIPPPQGFDENFSKPTNRTPSISPAPAPFDGLQMQISPRIQADKSITLSVMNLKLDGVFQSPSTIVSDLREGESLAFALPRSSPKTHTFLLLNAREDTPNRFGFIVPVPPRILPRVGP